MSSRNGTLAIAVAGGAVAAGLAYWVLFKPTSSANDKKARSSTPATAEASSTQGGSSAPSSPAGSPVPEEEVAPLLVIYGSATGTAEQMARAFSREATAKGIRARCADPADMSMNDLRAPATGKVRGIVAFIATAGEGDPTDNFAPLLKAMEDAVKDGNKSALKGVPFAVFGLGDSSYTQYNVSGKSTDEMFGQLGGDRVIPIGLGDARQDVEAAFETWKDDLYEPLAHALDVHLANGEVAPELIFSYLPDTTSGPVVFTPPPSQLEPTQRTPLLVRLIEKKQLLTPKGAENRSTLLLTFDIKGSSITYQSGDHCGIMGCNDDAAVAEIATLIDLDDKSLPMLAEGSPLDTVVELCSTVRQRQRASMINTLPARVTLREALKWYPDLNGKPRKTTLAALSRYCTDDAERESMTALFTRDKAAEFNAIIKEVRNIRGWLKKFPSCRPPVGHFLELIPRIAPRYYSIASDQLTHKTTLELCVAIEEGGLCSAFFAAAEVGSLVPMFVRKSTFHLPIRAKDRPLLLIGPGTGVAPLRGFCFRREAWKKRNATLGECALFFGCRSVHEDHVFSDEMNSFLGDGILSLYDTAFSRDQAEKVYVTHRLKAQKESVLRIMNAGGAIYVCGDAAGMAVDVERLLAELIAEDRGISVDAARAELGRMTKANKYLKDVW